MYYVALNMAGLDKKRDLAYVVKSVSLDGKDGESEQLVMRIDPSSGKKIFENDPCRHCSLLLSFNLS